MSIPEEEARAAAWRQSAERRHASRQQQEAALAGSSSARVALATRWAGVIQWLGERRYRSQSPVNEGDAW